MRNLAPRAGFEPATIRLTVGCSTAELPRKGRTCVRARLRITKPPALAKDEIVTFRTCVTTDTLRESAASMSSLRGVRFFCRRYTGGNFYRRAIALAGHRTHQRLDRVLAGRKPALTQ